MGITEQEMHVSRKGIPKGRLTICMGIMREK